MLMFTNLNQYHLPISKHSQSSPVTFECIYNLLYILAILTIEINTYFHQQILFI